MFCDVEKQEEVKKLFDDIKKKWGEIDFDEILETTNKCSTIKSSKQNDFKFPKARKASRMIDLIESFLDQCCTSPDVRFWGVDTQNTDIICYNMHPGHAFKLFLQAIHSG